MSLIKIQRTVSTLRRIANHLFSGKEKNKQSSSPISDAKIGSTVLKMEKVTKSFPGVLANDNINFEVRKGEIHALLGENGAGKTTLMRTLYGLHQPDSGSIYIGGERVEFRSPLDAIVMGIGMVHQHFMVVDVFTVVENIAMGLNLSGIFWDAAQIEKKINDLSSKYGLKVDPRAKIWQLSVGEQQRVEIIKALSQGADLLILDEPTSVLTPNEVSDLFKTIRSLVKEGLTVIFITHKLHEVMAVSDRVTVLRNGKWISTVETKTTNKRELAKMMVGREVLFELDKPPSDKGRVILDVKELWALSDKEGIDALKGVSLSVCGGEIVGIAGVAGNGQRELIELITGLRKATKGKVYIDGRDMTNHSPKKIIEQKVTYIPENRITEGLIMSFTLADNLILKNFSSPPLSDRGLLNPDAIKRFADELISEFDVKTPSGFVPAQNLSGGNLQKLLLARELSQEPQLLIAAQPTKGLDVGATEFVRQRLIDQRGQGTAVLLVSEDLDELLALSDRIAVMFEGKISGLVENKDVNVEEIGLMMAGSLEI